MMCRCATRSLQGLLAVSFRALTLAAAVAVLAPAARAASAPAAKSTRDDAAIAEKVRQLGDSAWKTREEAQKALIAVGEPAIPEVETALKSGDAEVRQRAEVILQAIRKDLAEGASRAIAKSRIWTCPVKDGVASPAVVGGGVACFRSFDGYLRAVSVKTGKAMWVFEDIAKEGDAPKNYRMVASYPTLPAPLIVGDKVFVSSEFGRACALDLAKGEVLWKSASTEGFSPPAVAGDKVFLGGTEKDFRALDVATGKEVWKADLPGGVLARPVVVGDNVYVAARDNNLYAFSVKDGAKKTVIGDITDATDLIALEGGLLVARANEGLLCVDPAGGKQKWTYPLPQDPMQAQLLMIGRANRGAKQPPRHQGEEDLFAAGGALYATACGEVHAVAADSGKPLWTFKPQSKDENSDNPNMGMIQINGQVLLGGQGRFQIRSYGGSPALSAPCVVGETLYVTSPMGLHAIELKARTELWRLDMKQTIAARPVVADGILYYGTSDLTSGNARAGGGNINVAVALVQGGNGPAVVQKVQGGEEEKAAEGEASDAGLHAIKLKK